jgi:L-cysteine:1D-myo-inositol 2-amino-2-deoxy-alpha-D-glucopyranoside ligase
MAIRLTLLRHHYRSDWEWTDEQLWDAVDTLDRWRVTLARGAGADAAPVVDAVLKALAADLDAPTAVAAIEAWVAATEAGDSTDPDAAATVGVLLDAALGLAL